MADFLGRLLQCSPADIPVIRDGFGRPVSAEPPAVTGWPPGARLCLGIATDRDRQLLAVTRDLPVALSVHTVPHGPIGELLLPFTPLERRYVQESPAARRAHRLAQLWTRKEAALRLTGRGGLATADEIDALSEARDGKVVVPASLAYPGGVAYVRDLPAGPRAVACAATAVPAPGVRIRQPNSLDPHAGP
ncbi:4'-phosphopantetheinyl transferase superfamily protein [Streptomyces sp. NPDC048506]|uniref:4'-phosphopantetheinyl transferase family protein n=1 Tax=Streptomyces sp. NPDC048506 TaxID=3155028 RepID=UPI0034413F9A